MPQYLIRGFIGCAPRLDKTAMLRRLYESSADNSPQDSLGFWIQRCGFRILGTGFRIPQAKNVPLIPKSGFPYLGRDNSVLKSALRSRMTDRSSLRGAAVSAPRRYIGNGQNDASDEERGETAVFAGRDRRYMKCQPVHRNKPMSGAGLFKAGLK